MYLRHCQSLAISNNIVGETGVSKHSRYPRLSNTYLTWPVCYSGILVAVPIIGLAILENFPEVKLSDTPDSGSRCRQS